MPRKKLLLFPFGGNARESLIAIFAANSQEPQWEVLGFVDDDRSNHGKECCGVYVLGGRTIIQETPEAMVLALPGNPGNYNRRKEIIAGLQLEESRFATVLHPSVTKSPDATVGYNTLVMANVVLSCGVRIGSHCVILPNTVVSHDSSVGDYCCLGSNISVSGSVAIGQNCYIGSGTKMREKITIGAGALVGLGSNLIGDIPADVIAAGNPARVLKRL